MPTADNWMRRLQWPSRTPCPNDGSDLPNPRFLRPPWRNNAVPSLLGVQKALCRRFGFSSVAFG
jgi:hypothetical protein